VLHAPSAPAPVVAPAAFVHDGDRPCGRAISSRIARDYRFGPAGLSQPAELDAQRLRWTERGISLIIKPAIKRLRQAPKRDRPVP